MARHLKFVLDNILCNFEPLLENEIFGFVSFSTKYENECFLVNLIIFLAKFYIHGCKFARTKHFQTLKKGINVIY